MRQPVGLAEDEANLKQDALVLFTSDVHCGVDENFGFFTEKWGM